MLVRLFLGIQSIVYTIIDYKTDFLHLCLFILSLVCEYSGKRIIHWCLFFWNQVTFHLTLTLQMVENENYIQLDDLFYRGSRVCINYLICQAS